MPTQNLRKHIIPSGADKSFNRATIFEAFGNSIHDIVPVANVTERAQLVTALTAKGIGPTTVNPLFVYRADAPGLHRIEYTTNGLVWLSDVLTFASKTDADSFGASNGGLLSRGDEARIGADRYFWSGTAWLIDGWIDYTPSAAGFTLVGGKFTVAKYKLERGRVTVKIRAAVAAMGANPMVELPMSCADALVEHLPGSAALIPGAGSEVVGTTRKQNANQVMFFYHFIAGTTVYINNISASAPFAWGTSGTIAATFSYEPA